jgi:uncharacterized membrane protein YfcA
VSPGDRHGDVVVSHAGAEYAQMTAAAVGVVAGLCVGTTSTGGGALLTPGLILVVGVPPSIAIGTDVAIASVMKLVAGGAYIWRSQVHWPSVWRLALGSIPGVLVGLFVLTLLKGRDMDVFLQRLLAALLVVAGSTGLLRLVIQRGQAAQSEGPGRITAAILGFLTGLLVTLTSVGSGSLLLAVLSLFFPMAATQLVGTDIVHALMLTSVAGAGHFLAGRVDLHLASAVLLGGIPGVLVGVRVATAVPERWLRGMLSFVLIVLAGQLLTTGKA